MKYKFWEQLNIVTKELQEDIMMVGDFNARAGRSDEIKGGVIGNYGEDRLFLVLEK